MESKEKIGYGLDDDFGRAVLFRECDWVSLWGRGTVHFKMGNGPREIAFSSKVEFASLVSGMG